MSEELGFIGSSYKEGFVYTFLRSIDLCGREREREERYRYIYIDISTRSLNFFFEVSSV